MENYDPGRTFLGKRRYFSGIAALTPLTPLTYKQNAVNAFIPTKKTPCVKTWLLSSSLAKFQQFRSDFSSKFCWVEFLLVTSSIFICCIKGPCLSRSCLVWARNVFFFRLKSLNCFPVKTHVFGKPFVFCTFCLKSWGFEFAPARGSPASVSDHVMTRQDYIKVEQVRTWLLSSSLAKFQQFESECFFQVCFNLFLQCFFSDKPALKLDQQFTVQQRKRR